MWVDIFLMRCFVMAQSVLIRWCVFHIHSSYLFDMRRLKKPLNVFKDHVSAVIDMDFSPTGRELVTGSYDKTVRIFEVDKVCGVFIYAVLFAFLFYVLINFCLLQGHSREVYHTKRMQRITSVMWTLDNKYIMSGSDEMNIRIWKAKAWEKLGTVSDFFFCRFHAISCHIL